MFQKGNQILMFAFMAIGLILMIMTMAIEVTDDGECANCGVEGLFIGFTYFLLAITVIAALGGTVMTAIANPKKLTGSAIGIGAMVVVFVISYALASGEVYESYGSVTESTSRMVGAGLFTFYILLVLAVLSIIYASISRMIK